MSKYVRLKPYNPHLGQVLRRLSVGGRLFREEQGWYIVDDATAVMLSKFRQIEADPRSPAAFDIGTKREALVMEREERKARRIKARVQEAQAMGRPLGALASEASALDEDAPLPAPEPSNEVFDEVGHLDDDLEEEEGEPDPEPEPEPEPEPKKPVIRPRRTLKIKSNRKKE